MFGSDADIEAPDGAIFSLADVSGLLDGLGAGVDGVLEPPPQAAGRTSAQRAAKRKCFIAVTICDGRCSVNREAVVL